MAIVDTLREITQRVESELKATDTSAALDALRVKVLGKKGELTALLKGMGQLAPEERPKVGAQINEVREHLTTLMADREGAIKKAEREAALKAETIDVTEPRKLPRVGAAHPITLVMDELIECFSGLGFEVMEGPEVELDHYNFELMNLPKNHPARDAQDTFYMDDNIVLRTHTSPMQARAMLTRKPPIRIICPGRVYRADELDATH
ncbi:MAG: phenylalanine--tRNA ligase subunit alpha, partial [Clostridia bacterium]|nr:phenylalanine--tRNA ligase subunit alpha [Clostridia bacterium]